jgi:carboxylesterase
VSVDAGAFELGPVGRGGPAVLCLHGLSGTPYEVRAPAEALAERGFACLGPVLPGHGETPEALAGTRREQWVASAQAAFDRLDREHEVVYVLGLSMGGVLALSLCQERQPGGALVMAAPLDLGRLVRWGVPLVSRLIRFVPSRSDIRDPEALARHPSYDRMPLPAVRELIVLGREVASRLASVEAPLQLLYSRGDQTVPLANAERIQEGVGSAQKSLRVLETSGHVLPVDVEREAVAGLAVEFFSELERRSRH